MTLGSFDESLPNPPSKESREEHESFGRDREVQSWDSVKARTPDPAFKRNERRIKIRMK
jgi:hypothetical protein